MESVTKKRILFWGIIFILMLSMSYIGLNKYKQGYGKIGKIRYKLMDIQESFRTLDYIIRYGGISTEVKGDKLYIIHANGKNKDKTICNYKLVNSTETISCESNSNTLTDETIMKGLIDAVLKKNDSTESIFEKYNISEFMKLKLEDGLTYERGNKLVLNIDINTDLYNKIDSLGLEKIVNPVITENDYENLQTDLNNNDEFKITKNTIILIAKNTTDYYVVYAQDTDNNDIDNLHQSILNAIKILNEDTYNAIMQTQSKLKDDIKTDKYEIENKVKDEEIKTLFDSNSDIIKIVIFKK